MMQPQPEDQAHFCAVVALRCAAMRARCSRLSLLSICTQICASCVQISGACCDRCFGSTRTRAVLAHDPGGAELDTLTSSWTACGFSGSSCRRGYECGLGSLSLDLSNSKTRPLGLTSQLFGVGEAACGTQDCSKVRLSAAKSSLHDGFRTRAFENAAPQHLVA